MSNETYYNNVFALAQTCPCGVLGRAGNDCAEAMLWLHRTSNNENYPRGRAKVGTLVHSANKHHIAWAKGQDNIICVGVCGSSTESTSCIIQVLRTSFKSPLQCLVSRTCPSSSWSSSSSWQICIAENGLVILTHIANGYIYCLMKVYNCKFLYILFLGFL